MNVMFDLEDHQPFDYHDEYYSINTGAHRKGGVELETPSLTHHLGFWFPNQKSDVPQRTVERYGAIVDSYVTTIYRALCRLDDFECNFRYLIEGQWVLALFGGAYHVSDEDPMPSFAVMPSPPHFALKDAIESDNRILFMKARWGGLKVIFRCEFHSEYFSITRLVTVVDGEALPAEVEELQQHLATMASLKSAEAEGEPVESPAIRDCHVFMYQGFWERLDLALFGARHLFAAGSTNIRSRIFADFRGLVMAGTDGLPNHPLSMESFAADEDRGRPFEDTWPLDCLIPAIWPFLTAREGLDLKRREFTASFMLGKRAVYITALGPQPPADGGFRCAPLNYFLVARPISDWQLGALVDRLHFMGTVRLAGLMELQPLRIAGANLRDVEKEAGRARKAIEDNDTDLAYDHYKRVIALLAHKDARHQPIFHAGLQYRVERSRYYVKRFADFVPFLGMSQIEGFQHYEHFVRSRLGGIYDYIDRLGYRQERASGGATAIFQAISLRQAVEANKQNSVISSTIEKLQTKAEIALLAIIVPHYMMEIVHDFQEEYKAGDKTAVVSFYAILGVGLMLASVSLSTYIMTKMQNNETFIVRKIILKYIMLAAVSVAIIVILYRYLGATP